MGVNAGGKFIDVLHQNIYRLFCLALGSILVVVDSKSFEVVALSPLSSFSVSRKAITLSYDCNLLSFWYYN
jgi:hypothetical protein